MKPFGKQFSKITAQAYKLHGHAWAGVLANWPTIVGSQLANITRPEKINWPGSVRASKHQKIGGTLTLMVGYGRALEVQHMSMQIMDRINTYFGYAAIGNIKIKQGIIEKPKVTTSTKPPPLTHDQQASVDRQVKSIDDHSLHIALSRLAKGVLADTKEH